MLAVDSADGAIVQDLLLPVNTSEAFVDYVPKDLEIWPLWICPVRKRPNEGEVVGWPFYSNEKLLSVQTATNPSGYVVSKDKGELTLNFGVWGPTDPAPAAVHETNRGLERKLKGLRGMKFPYAAIF